MIKPFLLWLAEIYQLLGLYTNDDKFKGYVRIVHSNNYIDHTYKLYLSTDIVEIQLMTIHLDLWPDITIESRFPRLNGTRIWYDFNMNSPTSIIDIERVIDKRLLIVELLKDKRLRINQTNGFKPTKWYCKTNF